tara:strand:+ start:61 stop:333 length:273 start_codon:yes stop_codon:yes gene_type:complete
VVVKLSQQQLVVVGLVVLLGIHHLQDQVQMVQIHLLLLEGLHILLVVVAHLDLEAHRQEHLEVQVEVVLTEVVMLEVVEFVVKVIMELLI